MNNNISRKCGTCRYQYVCVGLDEHVRAKCVEWEDCSLQEEYGRGQTARWDEMSYRQLGDPRNTPNMQTRLRNGE